MSVRDKPPAPGASPTGANEGLFGVLQAFIRSPQFVAVMADHGFVKTAPGDLKCAASADAPPGGWLLCDFSLYPVSTYPALAAVLFKAGYEQAPYAPGALSLADFGGYAGRALNTLSIANLPAHTHPPATPGTNFLLTDASAVLQSAGAGGFKYSTGFNATTGATGSGSGFTAMPPFTSVNIWIKT
jgi:microcystin-dependent protein